MSAMGGVAVYEPPCIRVTIPHLECWVDRCTRPLVADMIWHDERAGALHREEICGLHLAWFKEMVRENGGGALFFPLHGAPPLEFVAAKVQEELRRRQPQPVYQPMWGTLNYTFSGTAGTSWVNFR